MLIAGPFCMMYVPSTLIVPGDATTTANYILAAKSLFQLGIIGHLIVLFADLGVAVLLYVLLEPVSKAVSLVAAVFRLIMTAMRGINLVSHFVALILLSGAGYLAVFETDQLHALVLLCLTAFEDGVLLDLIFFSPHLFFLGYLVFKSGYFPRVLGVLLILGSFAYLADNIAGLFFPEYAAVVSQIVLVPEVLAELPLLVWLLVKGVNVEQWKKRALESA
jgi:hypothetical protein